MFRRYTGDPQVTQHLNWSPHASLDQARDFVQQAIDGWRREETFSWLIRSRQTGELLGMIELCLEPRQAELGYALARDAWGQGFMLEAVQAVVEIAFAVERVKRVWAVCGVDNHASLRVLEKAGLRREALWRDFIDTPHEHRAPGDAYYYALDRDGWQRA